MASEHDVTIYWGNKPTYNRFKVAVEIMDAVNMRAIAREFVKVVDAASADTKSTDEVWADPAVRLVVNKLESLSHSEANFSEAYAAAVAKMGVTA